MQDPDSLFVPPSRPVLGVVGLGYVGLPLAVEFGRRLETVGFDISPQRVEELQAGYDATREVEPGDLDAAEKLSFSADESALNRCNVLIITVPTPVDAHRTPNLTPLQQASKTVARHLARGNVVVYESTVYPGATEEVCVPILEKTSGLVFNSDFFVGYSPERINPGDKAHRFTTITKVTAGSTPAVSDFVDGLYGEVVTAGTHKASSIQVAEAAKVIENTQRDVNIALVNELALLFNRLGIDTEEVLEAAGTKWNFLPFRPGLVGGHCIGVDPYYLTYKAQEIGHHPGMILAGRRINDHMGPYIADSTVKLMVKKGFTVVGSRILVMGLTFKENCPDLRNTRVMDIIADLTEYNAKVEVWDPWVTAEEAQEEYGIAPFPEQPDPGRYDAVILAVPHKEFLALGPDGVRALGREGSVFFDVKSVFPREDSDIRL